MTQYRTEVVMTNKTFVRMPGELVELTEEEAQRHLAKGYVSVVDDEGKSLAKQTHDETSFKALSAKEQKAIVQELGGDLEEHTNADARWAYFEGAQ